MVQDHGDATTIQQQREIQQAITRLFAPEDEGLRQALLMAQKAGLPEIQISPVQGKFLQWLAIACQARKILEIGSLAGYSGIWLARALPPGGKLITLEINEQHAEIVRQSFKTAGVSDQAEVRVGPALDTLPQLTGEAPFDLVFIDADKPPYPSYLEWALKLTRPGSIIAADNCIRAGDGLREDTAPDEYTRGIATYNKRVREDPRLVALALAMDDDYTDGFTIAIVKPHY